MAHHHDDDVADARKRAEQERRKQETSGRFNLPVGKTTFRVLKTPGDKERNSPPLYIQFLAHSNVGPRRRFLRCGNEPGERAKNCWLCKKADKLQRKGKTKQAAALRPQLKLAVQIAVLDKESGELIGPLLWTMSSGKKATGIGYKVYGIFTSKKAEKYLDHKRG